MPKVLTVAARESFKAVLTKLFRFEIRMIALTSDGGSALTVWNGFGIKLFRD